MTKPRRLVRNLHCALSRTLLHFQQSCIFCAHTHSLRMSVSGEKNRQKEDFFCSKHMRSNGTPRIYNVLLNYSDHFMERVAAAIVQRACFPKNAVTNGFNELKKKASLFLLHSCRLHTEKRPCDKTQYSAL